MIGAFRGPHQDAIAIFDPGMGLKIFAGPHSNLELYVMPGGPKMSFRDQSAHSARRSDG
jgi:hypothetical protein